MKKLFFAVLLVALGFSSLAHAGDARIEAGKTLVGQGVSCGQLTDSQLEQIGDYYMELRHPGDAHEWMEAMMGGEGSETLRLAHVRMAQVFYCGQGPAGTDRYWMMPMMGFNTQTGTPNYANGMMGNWNTGWNGMMGYGAYGWSINGILWTLLLSGGVAFVFLGAWRLWQDTHKASKPEKPHRRP